MGLFGKLLRRLLPRALRLKEPTIENALDLCENLLSGVENALEEKDADLAGAAGALKRAVSNFCDEVEKAGFGKTRIAVEIKIGGLSWKVKA